MEAAHPWLGSNWSDLPSLKLTVWKNNHLKMYPLLKMVIFQPVMLVLWGGGEIDTLHQHILPSLYIPRTQMTLDLIGKGLVLEG